MSRLSSVDVGRLAWVADGEPRVLPVNYGLRAGAVVIRTSASSSMALGAPGNIVAFEVDGVDFGTLTGWSVVVTGVCRMASTAQAAGVTPWVQGPRNVTLTVRADRVTGRQLTAPGDV
jgi:nitroimidazol reductase NimA-like FMN-containing flavoprotein (pyridoxamine 5'-phosphate oxidase superfamily)